MHINVESSFCGIFNALQYDIMAHIFMSSEDFCSFQKAELTLMSHYPLILQYVLALCFI